MQRVAVLPRLARLFAASMYMLLFGICASTAAENADAGNPCGLLSAAEVEAVLGEPLAGPPFRASNGLPDPDGESCRYEASAFRAIDISVDWSNGGQKFGLINMVGGIADKGGLKGVVTLSNGTELRGEWDEARDFLCCEFNALRGDQLVDVDIASSRASLEQAASLADLAVQRLDQPLSVDDAPGLAAALERDKSRPVPRPGCDLVSRSEAEAIVGAPLSADPQGSEASCSYVWSPAGSDYTDELTLSITWRGGLAEMRQAQAAIGQALSFMTSEGLVADQAQQSGGDLFDERADSFIAIMAVRKDVLLSIETGGTNNDLATAFIAAAAKNL